MARYIDISFKKTVKIDSDNLQEAIKTAKEEFYQPETQKKLLNEVNVTFKENPIIRKQAETIARLYQKESEFSQDNLQEFLDVLFGSDEVKINIYNDILKILKTDYHYEDLNIKI